MNPKTPSGQPTPADRVLMDIIMKELGKPRRKVALRSGTARRKRKSAARLKVKR